MHYLLWTVICWAAVSVLAVPLVIRFCRCVARFDPTAEQLAAASLPTDVLRAAGWGTTVRPPARG